MSVTVGIIAKKAVKVIVYTAPKAISAILNPEKTGSKLLVAIIAVCSPLILIVVLLSGVTSAVSGYVSSGPGMSDFWQSDLYVQMEKANNRWTTVKIAQIVDYAYAEDVPQENKIGIDYNALPLQEKINFLAKNNVLIEIAAPAEPYTLAYINHCEAIKSKWGYVFELIVNLDEESDTISYIQIQDFYNAITRIDKSSCVEKDVVKIVYSVQVLEPEEIAQLYWPADSLTAQMYIDSYEQYSHYLGESSTLPVVIHNTELPIPHYFQSDYKNVPYGKGTIATSGCAPTTIAMCVSYLSHSTITPADVVAFTGNRFYNWGPDGGSYWSIFPACAAHWNCALVETHDPNVVMQALQNGYPVIASMKPGHFTQNGHFIVLCGSSEDGSLYVNDPSKSNYKKYGNQVPAEWVFEEAKGYFIFKGEN